MAAKGKRTKSSKTVSVPEETTKVDIGAEDCALVLRDDGSMDLLIPSNQDPVKAPAVVLSTVAVLLSKNDPVFMKVINDCWPGDVSAEIPEASIEVEVKVVDGEIYPTAIPRGVALTVRDEDCKEKLRYISDRGDIVMVDKEVDLD